MIEITDVDTQPIDCPKAKKAEIPGCLRADIKPRICGDHLVWDASIKPESDLPFHTWLLFGSGRNPESSMADAVIQERRLLAERVRRLAAIEVELGFAGKTDVEIRKMLAQIQGGA